MKLYLSNVNLADIQSTKLSKYLTNEDKYIELYSNDGIYVCKNNQGFKKLDIIDGNIVTFDDYFHDHNLIVDESYVFKSKEYTSKLPSDHHRITLSRFEYKTSDKSPVTMVLEKIDNHVTNMYFMLMNNHGKYTEPDINNQFTKETIQSLYSLTV